MEALLLLPALLGALIATGLFFFGLLYVLRTFALKEKITELARALGFTRTQQNPIIMSEHDWEAQGVMNPGAVRIDGVTHLFYRAAGTDGVSRIGYASSKDGMHVDERLPYPVFALPSAPTDNTRAFAFHSGLSRSGGTVSGTGTEDPRAVVIDDRLYLSFNGFEGWNSLRIGISSIALQDLLKKNWKWSDPVYLSPLQEVHKNWVLFPEKINGKFAILHSLRSGSRDRVVIEYVDSLEEEPSTPIHSPYPHHQEDDMWDSTLRGAGPPPLKTPEGWLVLYHATDSLEPHKYKIGALLLDVTDPSHVIARAPMPVLEPDAPYENNGAKSGVVYACGAVLHGDELRIYYGGSDSNICTAATSLSKLLKKLGPVNEKRKEVHVNPLIA